MRKRELILGTVGTSGNRKHSHVSTLLCAIGMGIVACLVASCSSSGSGGSGAASAAGGPASAAATSPAKTTKIRVVFPSPNVVSAADFFGALYQGYFKQAGLDVSYNVAPGTTSVTQVMTSGKADVTISSSNTLIAAVARDYPMQMFYLQLPRSVFDTFVKSDSSIKSAADLKGKTVGVSSGGAVGVSLTKAYAESAGVNPKDIKFLTVGEPGPAAAAFTRGDIDAYAGTIFDAAVLDTSGFTVRGIAPKSFQNETGSGYWASTKWLKDNHDAAIAFSKALQQGLDWAKANPEKFMDAIKKYQPEAMENSKSVAQEVALRKTMFELLGPADPGHPNGYIPPATAKTWYDSALKSGTVQPISDPTSIYTNDIVDETS